jgi:tRNA-binding EMAP/Myf-like protein
MEIASGLQKFVSLDNMRGKVLVMTNLKPRKMGGF